MPDDIDSPFKALPQAAIFILSPWADDYLPSASSKGALPVAPARCGHMPDLQKRYCIFRE